MYLPARESRAGHRDAPRWGIPFIRREIDTLSCLLLPVFACFCLSFLPSLTPPRRPPSLSPLTALCSVLPSHPPPPPPPPPSLHHPPILSSSLQHTSRKHHALTEQRVRPLPSQNRAFRSIGLSICCIRSHHIRHISIKHTFIIHHHIQPPTSAITSQTSAPAVTRRDAFVQSLPSGPEFVLFVKLGFQCKRLSFS